MHLFRYLSSSVRKQREKCIRSKKEDLDASSSNSRRKMLGKLSKYLNIITFQPPQYKFLKYMYHIHFFLK